MQFISDCLFCIWKNWTYFGSLFYCGTGKLLLLLITKYWKIIQPSGHNDVHQYRYANQWTFLTFKQNEFYYIFKRTQLSVAGILVALTAMYLCRPQPSSIDFIIFATFDFSKSEQAKFIWSIVKIKRRSKNNIDIRHLKIFLNGHSRPLSLFQAKIAIFLTN